LTIVDRQSTDQLAIGNCQSSDQPPNRSIFNRRFPKQFYGMREFAITDPDGHLITFAEQVAGD
jgi:catechol 2,3-dioxygenase-like lactoylglutathione lyase family enzyme